MKYTVKVPVETLLTFTVTAENEEEAREIVGMGDGEYVGSLTPKQMEELDFCWDYDMNNWKVEGENSEDSEEE